MQGNYGGQPLPSSGTPQVIQPSYPGFNGAPVRYNRKAAMGLGITQMIIGIMCFILNILVMKISDTLYFQISCIAYGIWGGILIFVAGLLQVLSAKRTENKCLIIGTMVMTIIAALACAVIFMFSVAEAVIGDNLRKNYEDYKSNHYFTYNSSTGTIDLVLGTILAILAFVEAVIAITSSAFCCGVVCCKSSYMARVPVYTVGNQPVIFQASNTNQPYAPQLPFSHSQEVPSNPPPPYYVWWNAEAKPQQYPNTNVPTDPGLTSNPPPPSYEWNAEAKPQQYP